MLAFFLALRAPGSMFDVMVLTSMETVKTTRGTIPEPRAAILMLGEFICHSQFGRTGR
jgi:hypothetical protein